ncbi:Dps family protein [Desertimonas flava]|jgi:starvation-inducible DNA-binding protein|uniref:Dps family protein n=1 Tax=Desertimonas flava TaxID=2064846 RepID=UPI000E3568DF|nr:DNA starvation/stationary phase protection protein [Desertimonas flava]
MPAAPAKSASKRSPAKKAAAKESNVVAFTTPGLDVEASKSVVDILADRLVSLTDLTLTLKHIHWNVTGPGFIAVHQMLDPQYEGVALMVDATAERIATLGGEPNGLPGHLVATRSWDDYSLGRDTVQAHLGALDLVYTGVIDSHRDAIEALEELDPVTQDLVISQTATLEQYHWFVRAHLENSSGSLVTSDATSETGAARAARGRRR